MAQGSSFLEGDPLPQGGDRLWRSATYGPCHPAPAQILAGWVWMHRYSCALWSRMRSDPTIYICIYIYGNSQERKTTPFPFWLGFCLSIFRGLLLNLFTCLRLQFESLSAQIACCIGSSPTVTNSWWDCCFCLAHLVLGAAAGRSLQQSFRSWLHPEEVGHLLIGPFNYLEIPRLYFFCFLLI